MKKKNALPLTKINNWAKCKNFQYLINILKIRAFHDGFPMFNVI